MWHIPEKAPIEWRWVLPMHRIQLFFWILESSFKHLERKILRVWKVLILVYSYPLSEDGVDHARSLYVLIGHSAKCLLGCCLSMWFTNWLSPSEWGVVNNALSKSCNNGLSTACAAVAVFRVFLLCELNNYYSWSAWW